MSRIGRKPIVIPAGVEVTIKDNVVTVKGPKGTLNSKIHPMMLSLIHILVNADKFILSVDAAKKLEEVLG